MPVKSWGNVFLHREGLWTLQALRNPVSQQEAEMVLEQRFLDSGQKQRTPLPWALWLSDSQN